LELVEDVGGEEGQEEGDTKEGGMTKPLEEQPLISLQALQGMNSFQTMRVEGKVGFQALHILVDSGSTHNFLDLNTAKKLRCELMKIPPLMVAVANGA